MRQHQPDGRVALQASGGAQHGETPDWLPDEALLQGLVSLPHHTQTRLPRPEQVPAFRIIMSRKALDNPNFYTIAWIAALPIERAAATAMLDEEHAPPNGFSRSVKVDFRQIRGLPIPFQIFRELPRALRSSLLPDYSWNSPDRRLLADVVGQAPGRYERVYMGSSWRTQHRHCLYARLVLWIH